MHLNPTQIKLLKKVSKQSVIRTDKFDLSDVEYLRSLGLTVACSADKQDDFFYQATITEKGKAVLYEYTAALVEKWVPVIISNLIAVSALIVSIIALCTR